MSMCSLGIPAIANAQMDLGMFEISHILELTNQDPRVIAVRIINIVLEFSAILLLLAILYGGFQFLVSFGHPDKVKRAVATIMNAVIGMVLIALSWGIAKFVLTSISQAVSGDASGMFDMTPNI